METHIAKFTAVMKYMIISAEKHTSSTKLIMNQILKLIRMAG